MFTKVSSYIAWYHSFTFTQPVHSAFDPGMPRTGAEKGFFCCLAPWPPRGPPPVPPTPHGEAQADIKRMLQGFMSKNTYAQNFNAHAFLSNQQRMPIPKPDTSQHGSVPSSEEDLDWAVALQERLAGHLPAKHKTSRKCPLTSENCL